MIIIILLSLFISEDSDQGNNKNEVSTLKPQVLLPTTVTTKS